MNETDLHQRLDHRGLLNDAHGPGCYALRVAVPDDAAVVRERWAACHDAEPPDDALARLAAADRVAYVGAASDVYARLTEHVNGDVRKTALLEAFDPAAVVDVWPTTTPFDREFGRALSLAREGWVVWVNGELLG
jgi:hypothetical protein